MTNLHMKYEDFVMNVFQDNEQKLPTDQHSKTIYSLSSLKGGLKIQMHITLKNPKKMK